jgi:hypothetical protein
MLQMPMAMPTDFLIEQPTKFEYGQDARRLGFDKLLGRVDGVIEYRRYLLQCGSSLVADFVAEVSFEGCVWGQGCFWTEPWRWFCVSPVGSTH